MLRNTIVFGLLIGVSVAVPLGYQANPEAWHSLVQNTVAPSQSSDIGDVAMISPEKSSLATSGGSGRKVEIEADDRGHFTGSFKINGHRLDALIDTGATAVAVNITTARKLGVHILTSDMKNTVNTANGKAKATVVQIDRIEIGKIVVENVPAIVLEDSALSTNLIGMTFLSRLKRFQADGKTLQLVQ